MELILSFKRHRSPSSGWENDLRQHAHQFGLSR
jgi:hypothetical protein